MCSSEACFLDTNDNNLELVDGFDIRDNLEVECRHLDLSCSWSLRSLSNGQSPRKRSSITLPPLFFLRLVDFDLDGIDTLSVPSQVLIIRERDVKALERSPSLLWWRGIGSSLNDDVVDGSPVLESRSTASPGSSVGLGGCGVGESRSSWATDSGKSAD